MTIRLVGDQRLVDGWQPATRKQLERYAADVDDPMLIALGDHDVLLAWIGGPCDVGATLEIEPRSLTLTEDPRSACDAQAVTRGVALTATPAFDAAQIVVTVVPATRLRSGDDGEGDRAWGPLAVIPPQDGTDLAREQGTLRVTDACVYLDRAGESTFLYWPADRTTWDEASRAITFTNYDGTVVTVRGGDIVVLGGGGDSEAEGDLSAEAWVATMPWVVPPASSCSLDPRFGVGVVGIGRASAAR